MIADKDVSACNNKIAHIVTDEVITFQFVAAARPSSIHWWLQPQIQNLDQVSKVLWVIGLRMRHLRQSFERIFHSYAYIPKMIGTKD